MKKIFTLISFILFAISVNAQTPFAITSSHKKKDVVELRSAASTQNPWLNAGLRYNLRGDVSQSFLLNAQALYEPIRGDNFGFPFMSNVGLNNPDSTSKYEGVSLGAFPYYYLLSDSYFRVVAHSGFSYRFVEKADASINEFRFLVGLEAALYPKDGTSPMTFSVAPEVAINNGLSNWGLGITGVIPIANGLGALIEGTVPFDSSVQSVFSLGILASGQLK